MISLMNKKSAEEMQILSEMLGPEIWKPRVVLDAYSQLEKRVDAVREAVKTRGVEDFDRAKEDSVAIGYNFIPVMNIIRESVELIRLGEDYDPLTTGAAIIEATMIEGEILGDKPYGIT